jgi:hypothetical protein
MPTSVPVRRMNARDTGHVDASVATTDQKVRGSNPFERTRLSLALTSKNGQCYIISGDRSVIMIHDACQRPVHGGWIGRGAPRGRGSVRRVRDRIQIRVSAGTDPSTGERIVLVDSVPIEAPGKARSENAGLIGAVPLRPAERSGACWLTRHSIATGPAALPNGLRPRRGEGQHRGSYRSGIRWPRSSRPAQRTSATSRVAGLRQRLVQVRLAALSTLTGQVGSVDRRWSHVLRRAASQSHLRSVVAYLDPNRVVVSDDRDSETASCAAVAGQ